MTSTEKGLHFAEVLLEKRFSSGCLPPGMRDVHEVGSVSVNVRRRMGQRLG